MCITMAELFLVLAFGFLVFNSSADKHVFAESEENWDDIPDWKQAVRKIKELENLVKIQNERISILEERPDLSEWKSTAQLQETVNRENDRIDKLVTRISELESNDDGSENWGHSDKNTRRSFWSQINHFHSEKEFHTKRYFGWTIVWIARYPECTI